MIVSKTLIVFTLIGETVLTVKPASHDTAFKPDIVRQCQYIAKSSEISPYKVMTTYVPKNFKCERTIKL